MNRFFTVAFILMTFIGCGCSRPILHQKSNGLIELKRGNVDEAIKEFDREIAFNEKNWTAYDNRGTAYGAKGEFTRAEADFHAALKINSRDNFAYKRLAIIALKRFEHDSALVYLDKAIDIQPGKDGELYDLRGLAYLKKGNALRAVDNENRAIQINPRDATAYDIRAAAYLFRGDMDRSIKDENCAIELNPQYAEAYDNRALIFQKKGDINKMIADDIRSIELDPLLSAPYNRLAWIWAVSDDPQYRNGKKAVEFAIKACELSGWKTPEFLDTLAAAYAEAGDFDNAIIWENKYINSGIDPDALIQATRRLELYKSKAPYREYSGNR